MDKFKKYLNEQKVMPRSVNYSYSQIVNTVIKLSKEKMEFGRKGNVVEMVEQMGSEVVSDLINTTRNQFNFQFRNDEYVVSGDELKEAFFRGIKNQIKKEKV